MEKFNENLYKLGSAYLFHSKANIVFNPCLAGKDLKIKTIEAAKEFLEIACPVCLKGEPVKNICECVLLCGGNYYGLKEAFEDKYGSLQQVFIGIKRYQLPDKRWDARSTYDSFDSLPDNGVVLIGDTIATGSTIRKTVRMLRDEYKIRKFKLKKIIIYTLVGSKVAAEMIAGLEKEMNGTKIYFFASEGLFGLMPNGTDMPVSHKDTELIPEAVEELKKHPELKDTRCSVFDWGDRCKNPIKHYLELIDSCEEKTIRECAESELEKLNKEI
jgi:uracil phosphoribosyltransferase